MEETKEQTKKTQHKKDGYQTAVAHTRPIHFSTVKQGTSHPLEYGKPSTPLSHKQREPYGNQGVPVQYIKIFYERYSNFTTRITPFYDDITFDVSRGVRHSHILLPNLFTAALEDVMRTLEWDVMGVRIGGRLLNHLRFADDIVLITPSINEAKRMLAVFDDSRGKIGLRLNLTKTMFMRNGDGRRNQTALEAYKSTENVVKKTKNAAVSLV
ncbi:hypothetical protein ANCCEY_09618 [Ancylostoma ceylanicum]|uniref:Reverse transcriptase domain-containing protein n=1 Tax=Ancylostoma ceylanicum TaxID=53326 RepID=A0A0D6LGW0_9BILA|nr:hypothetical protein ANCCEY_09618 [Ancylostoma ceylanicum]